MRDPLTYIDEDAVDVTDRSSKAWRVGHHYRWSDVFNAWLDKSYQFTIKPSETGRQAFARECDDFFDSDSIIVFFDR